MKQTVIDWLAEQFDSIVELYPSQFEKINRAIEQAKEMEKEQIKDAFQLGKWNGYDNANKLTDLIDPSQYYNETYNSK